MSEKKRKAFWYAIGIGVLILFSLILVSSVINIGEKLRQISKYVEWAFYGLAVILTYFLIINPIRIIVFSPSLSIVTTLDKDSIKAHQTYKKVAKNILKNNDKLTSEEREALLNFHGWDELKIGLNLCLNGTIKKQIRNIIVRNAKTVMISTAISQNAKVDMYSVVVTNLKLIKEIVVACGFRPSMKNLSKLSVKVASTALIADGMESLKLEDVLPANAINSISSIPLLKPLLSSVSQGLVNALLTIRIGLVTRNYLFNDSHAVSRNDIRVQAFKEAMILLPLVLGEVVTFLPKRIIRVFGGKKDEEKEQESNNNLLLNNGEVKDE